MTKLNAAQRKLLVQFIKFGIIGVFGYLLDVAILTLCMKVFGMGPYVGRLFSFFITASFTWICNRLFTFREHRKDRIGTQWIKFLIVCAGGFILNYGTYAALIATIVLVHTYPALGVAAGSLAGMFFNFFVARKIVFR